MWLWSHWRMQSLVVNGGCTVFRPSSNTLTRSRDQLNFLLMAIDVLSIDQRWNGLPVHMNLCSWYAISSVLLYKILYPKATTVGSRCLCRYSLWSVMCFWRAWAKSTSPAQSRRPRRPQRPKNHDMNAVSQLVSYRGQCDASFVGLLYKISPLSRLGHR